VDELEAGSGVTEPQPSRGPARPRFRGWVKRAVEALSLLAALAFLAAVALNQFLFNQWGLSFLQVASPADVVMTGVGALLYLSPLVFIAAAGALLGLVTRRVRPLWWGLLLLECLVIVALAAAVAFRTSVTTPSGSGVTVLLILALVPLAHLLTHSRRREMLARRGATAAVGSLLVASVLAVAAGQVQDYSLDGVGPQRIHLLQPALPGCHGLVLWQGERATVVQCSYGRAARENLRVLYNAQDLVITTADVPHEPPQAKAAASARRDAGPPAPAP
jgi:hypothetical protein